MILACPTCDGRYDVTGHASGQRFRCRCGTELILAAPSPQAGLLACPRCGAGVSPMAHACAHCEAELLLKACPRCLSRVFHGHKHCPACGVELGLAAAGSADAARPCPRCDAAMRPRLVGDLCIDECPRCLGLFLDRQAVERLVTDRQQARAEALLGALPAAPAGDAARPGAAGARFYVRCPTCEALMHRRLFAQGAGVIVDVCRDHGTFFDVGELPQVIDFVMRGGLERAAHKALEEARARAHAERVAANAAAAELARRAPATSPRGDALVELLWSLFR